MVDPLTLVLVLLEMFTSSTRELLRSRLASIPKNSDVPIRLHID